MSLEYEWEGEGEWEAEGEEEGEEFLRGLGALARRAAASPTLRRAALTAARAALSGLREEEMEGEWEAEGEWEGEWEMEGEVNPIRRVYPDALMEHLGHAAAEAESEAEAEAFLGALIPLAARILPRAASAVMRVAPSLIRGVAGAARTLRRNPATRQLVRTLPTVVRRTTANLARQVSRGRPVTARSAVRTLARQTAQVLGSPQRTRQAYRRSRALDRRYHRAAAPSAAGRQARLCAACTAAGGVQ